jgi:4-amino-4-deoxy-L-arabinose transferase-like glycosyltransferase
MAVLVAFWFNMTSAVRHMSQTYDEGFHLFAAWRYAQCADFGINSEHPPMMKLVAGEAVKLAGYKPPAGQCGADPTTKDYGYAQGVDYLYHQGNDADAVLYTARRAVTVFPLALALLTFFFARRLFGYWAGVVALLMVAFDPNVLAHGPMLTTDTALCACLVGTVFAVYCYLARPAGWRLLLCGVGFGCTLAAKHSGILVLPITALLFILSWLHISRTTDSRRIRPLAKLAAAWLVMAAIGLAVLWAFYGFRFSGRPGNAGMTLPLPGFLALVRAQGTHGFLSDWAIPFAARIHLAPLPYLYGLTDVLSIMVPGQPPFLLGTLYPHGQWFYFPVVFVLKNTLPFFALLALGLAAGGWRRDNRGWKLTVLLVPVVVIWAAAMDSGLDIGYRHILTTFAFLCIAAAGGACWLTQRHRAWRFVIALLLVLHAATSLHAWPDYLPYMNEAFGGKDQAYRYMTDANVDWGQGVLETRDWLAANHVSDCWLAYDGAVDLRYYHLPCHELPGNEWELNQKSEAPAQATGLFIISSLAMSGVEFEPYELSPYAEFLHAKPVANIGGAMLVYRGTFDLHRVQAAELIIMSADNLHSNPALATQQARQSLQIEPTSVRAQLALGHAEEALGQREAAIAAYDAAIAVEGTPRRVWYPIELADAHSSLVRLGVLSR